VDDKFVPSSYSLASTYWIVSNKPVTYGDNIILTCKTDRTGTCRIRQWYGGHKNKLLLYNNGATFVDDRLLQKQYKVNPVLYQMY
jgi:hypothetical protein